MSVAVYGAYLLANGLVLLTIPGIALPLLGLPASGEIWIRVLGLVMAEIGFYFIYSARRNIVTFFPATVFGRCSAALVFVMLVALGLGPVQLLIFAAIDFLSAAWTHMVNKHDNSFSSQSN
jgi:hypothetical protein